jgi:heme oxygenase
MVRLNLETRGHHPSADAAWHRLVAPGRPTTREDYRALLERAYGFDSPLESALAYTPHLDSIADAHRRFRSGFIAQDLLTLGAKPTELTRVPQCMIAPFANVAEALGWLYVHERATLVHEAIRAELVARLPGVERATSYLSAYDGSVGARWHELGQALDRIAVSATVEQRIVDAAHDAFRALDRWFAPSAVWQHRTG